MRTFILIIVLLGVLAVVGANQVLYTIDQTEQAIITRLGEYQRTEIAPGLHIKTPFVEKVHRLEKRLLRFDANPSEFLTLEKKALVIDSYARYRIIAPRTFFEVVRTEPEAAARLEAIITSEIREEVATHNQIEVIRDRREDLMRDVTARSDVKAREFGIEVVDVRIVGADFPTEVSNSVYQRMQSERSRIANRFRAEGVEQKDIIEAQANLDARTIQSEATEKAAKIRGEGEAEAIRILGESISEDTEFYSFVRSLEALDNLKGGDTTLVLPETTELFRYIKSSEPTQED
ncbi:MAG: protease modulator HflC [Dehalococcoidia bacterium]